MNELQLLEEVIIEEVKKKGENVETDTFGHDTESDESDKPV